jgi:hypothetical protein
MGKWLEWYENQRDWNKMLDQVNEKTRGSDVQQASDTHATAEKARYDYPWKQLPSSGGGLGGSLGGGKKSQTSLSDFADMLSGDDDKGLVSNVKSWWKGEGFDEGSVGGVASDPSDYNIDYGGGGASDWFSNLFGGSEGGSSAGEGVGGVLGYIAAAIGGQVVATNSTGTVFEGQKTGNFFTVEDGNWKPSVATEPWLAKLHDNWGWEPTQGEKFDAAVKNGDWGKAAKRFPAAADYWADPIRSWLGFDTFSNMWGDTAGWIADPIGGVFDWIAGD